VKWPAHNAALPRKSTAWETCPECGEKLRSRVRLTRNADGKHLGDVCSPPCGERLVERLKAQALLEEAGMSPKATPAAPAAGDTAP
jgi:hypothetical protein